MGDYPQFMAINSSTMGWNWAQWKYPNLILHQVREHQIVESTPEERKLFFSLGIIWFCSPPELKSHNVTNADTSTCSKRVGLSSMGRWVWVKSFGYHGLSTGPSHLGVQGRRGQGTSLDDELPQEELDPQVPEVSS